jgi:hypothetical protein
MLFENYCIIEVYGEQVSVSGRPQQSLRSGEGTNPRRVHSRHQEQHSAGKHESIQGKEANDMWRRLKEDHYFWYNADKVVELCSVDETKVFMLVLLEEAIKVCSC